MALLESLVVGIGTSVAKGVLKMWMKNGALTFDVASGFMDFLKDRFKSVLERRTAERELSKIGDRSAQSFMQFIEKERSQLSEPQIEVIANAAAAVIDSTQLTPELLAQNNLSPEELTEFLLSRTGEQGGNPGLAHSSDAAQRDLFRHLLLHAAQQIIDVSSQLPTFNERMFSELLQRENRLCEIATRVMEGLDQLVAAQQGVDPEAERFETNYRQACVRRFDQLELFGVDLDASNKRYKLSVAYVTLEIEKTCIDEIDESDDLAIDALGEALPVDQALARAPRLLIRGLAGAGKTTLVQWATVYCAARQHTGELEAFNDFVPFVITLRDVENGKLPNPDEFAKFTVQHVGGEPERWSHRMLERGRAIVLIDGLDEAAEEQREVVRRWLQDLLAQYPQTRFVVTTRPHAVKEGWLDADKFLDATLQDLKPQEVAHFVQHWHDAVKSGLNEAHECDKLPELSEALIKQLKKNADLARMATSPLLAAMICALHRDRNQSLPHDRVGLYEACIDMFFRRDRERKLLMPDYVDLSDQQKQLLLQSFAWWLIKNGKTSATPTETHQRFDKALAEIANRPPRATGESVTRLFIQRVAILRQFALGKIDFPHRTFQEYFAALEAIAEDDRQLVINHAEQDQWREVAILMAGLIPNKEQAEAFVLGLLKRGDEEERHRETLYLIGAAARQGVHRLPDGSTLETETTQRLKQIIPPKSMRSAQSLAKAGNLVVPLLPYDRRKNGSAVAASARTLALINTTEALAALLDYMQDDRATVVDGNDKLLQCIPEEVRPEFARRLSPQIYQRNGLHSKNTTRLNLYRCQAITDCGALASCQSLQTLFLSGCTQLSDISALASCQSLETLDLSGCTQLSDISALASCQLLQTLTLSDCWQMSDIGVLASCRSLQSLNLSGCWQLSDISALASCRSLQSLNLSGCWQLSDISALASCQSLETLDLSGCTQLSDISALASCQSLETLDLSGCTQLSDISALASCQSLQTLHLSGCTQLSDISALASCPSLQSLNLNRCTQLSDLSVLAGCPSLQSLNLFDCTQLSDISALASCRSMQSLHLSWCTRLSDISALASCPSLQRLHLYGCPRLSNAAIANLRREIPKLTIFGR